MTDTQPASYLESLKPVGMQMGLERMRHITKLLDHPERAFPTVHIAGTNGKGSTAHMIAAMLTANGYRTGLFTSPAVTGIHDTIQIDGISINESDLAACIDRIRTVMPQGLSEFECTTAAALLYFQKEAIDIAVIECGLGGDTDATNILPPPLCAVLTPITPDHTALLGNSIEEITTHKCGIIKPPCQVVCAPTMDPLALGVIFETAANKGLTVHLPTLGECTVTPKGIQFSYRSQNLTLVLFGKHQYTNAVTALTVMDCLTQSGFKSDLAKCQTALSSLQMPCRQELVSTNPFVMLDGAHNPDGIRALCETIDLTVTEKITLVIGMLADKDINSCLQMLAPLCKRIICCTPEGNARALPADQMAAIASRYHENVSMVPSPEEAYREAKKTAERSPIIVGGSFYTAAAVRRTLI